MQLPRRMASREREPVVSESTKSASRSSSSEKAAAENNKADKESADKTRPPAIAHQSASPSRKLDPATRMLIDSELKDLPTEERGRWKNYLAGVETSQIPNILQKRAEGIVPPELRTESSLVEKDHGEIEKENDGSGAELTAKKLQPKRRTPPPEALSDGDLDAPTPEIQLSSGSDESLAEGTATSEPADASPAIKMALEEETSDVPSQSAGEVEQASQKELEAQTSEKGSIRKKWAANRRSDRSLSDRISGGRINTLTPPWSRDTTPPDDKTAKPPLNGKNQLDKEQATAFVEDPVRADPKADYWQDELRKLISLMEAEAARPPSDDSPAEKQAFIQRQVYLRMLYLMDAEPEKAQLPIADVQPVDQEFWTSMFWGMSNYFDVEHTGDPGTRAAQTIAQLNSAARHLQSAADLELRNVSFSPQIDGWGLYERFDRDEFEPGQEVLLYGEIRNFSAEATATGYYRTVINSTIEIVRTNEEDTILERSDLGETEDLCRGHRTDFYNSYRILIPSHLSPGSYQIRLTVEDKLSQRFATQTMGFTVR